MRLATLIALLAVTLVTTAVAADGPFRERPLRIHLGGATLEGTPEYLTIDDLERLPQNESRIFDPYLNRTILYRGVPLETVIARYASPGIKRVRVQAIDDYRTEFLPQDWEGGRFLLALRSDGERMGRSQSGPAKIVVTGQDGADRALQKWIWMIDRIDFLPE